MGNSHTHLPNLLTFILDSIGGGPAAVYCITQSGNRNVLLKATNRVRRHIYVQCHSQSATLHLMRRRRRRRRRRRKNKKENNNNN
jgi:hypothetical protein